MLDAFTESYIECALWSSTDDDGKPLDATRDISDLSPDALSRMVADCAKFEAENAADIGFRLIEAGHDLWLTRNGHGAGFWDGDWPETGERLTAASKAFGECSLYVGDDGLIYC